MYDDLELKWNMNYAIFLEYVEKFNEIPSNSTIYMDNKIGAWYKNQSALLKKGKLSIACKEKLDKVLPNWDILTIKELNERLLLATWNEKIKSGTPIDHFLNGVELIRCIKEEIYTCESWIKYKAEYSSMKNSMKAMQCYSKIYPYINPNYGLLLVDVFISEPNNEQVEKLLQNLPFADKYAMEEIVDEVIATITERERKCVTLRYGLVNGKYMTYEEIVELTGINRMYVINAVKKALRKMRHPSRSRRFLSLGELENLDLLKEEKLELIHKGYTTLQLLMKDEKYSKYIIEKSGILKLSVDEAKLLFSFINHSSVDEEIELLNLSATTCNRLRRAGIYTVAQLMQMNIEELMQVRCLGRKCAEEVAVKINLYISKPVEKEELSFVLQEKANYLLKHPHAIILLNNQYCFWNTILDKIIEYSEKTSTEISSSENEY